MDNQMKLKGGAAKLIADIIQSGAIDIEDIAEMTRRERHIAVSWLDGRWRPPPITHARLSDVAALTASLVAEVGPERARAWFHGNLAEIGKTPIEAIRYGQYGRVEEAATWEFCGPDKTLARRED